MTDIGMMDSSAARTTVSSSGNRNQSSRVAKNSLTLEDFYTLMAVQLQNQDMTSPMDNSEMLNQLVQMATIESMSQMTQMSTNQYASGLLGQQAEVVIFKDGQQKTVKGTVTGVNLAFSPPVIYLDGQSEEYPVSSVMAVGPRGTVTDEEGKDKGPGRESNQSDVSVKPYFDDDKGEKVKW